MGTPLNQTHTPLSTALISVDVVPLRLSQGNLQVLVMPARQTDTHKGAVLPSGRIDTASDQTLEEAARRHLAALTRTPPNWLEQVETIGNNQRDSRGWSLTVVYMALLGYEEGTERAAAQWLNLSPAAHTDDPLTLAYDHSQLVLRAVERLRSKAQYTSLPLHLLPPVFTMAEIRNTLHSLLGQAPPLRSIRNRFLENGVLEDTGEKRHGHSRPASLYRVARKTTTRLFSRIYESTCK